MLLFANFLRYKIQQNGHKTWLDGALADYYLRSADS